MTQNQNSDGSGQPPRRRSLTSLTLQWISERMKRSEELKDRVNSGEYSIDSEKVAASLVNNDGDSS